MGYNSGKDVERKGSNMKKQKKNADKIVSAHRKEKDIKISIAKTKIKSKIKAFLFFVGLILMLGSVGGIEQNRLDLLTGMALATAGLAIMYISGIKNADKL